MEEKLAKLLLNKTSPEDCFDIEYKGRILSLGIRPLSGKKCIEISEEISKCKSIKNEGQTCFQLLMENAIDLKHLCKAIAIATDHKNIKLVTSAILDLENTQIETLWHIVEKNSNATFFLNIMVLAQNMNLMKKVEKEG